MANNSIKNLNTILRYNFKIIFNGKLIWYFIAATIILIGFMYLFCLNPDNVIGEKSVFSVIIIPAFLIIFYPSVFGIQNDADAKILEILFGIPNYRYRVWGTRLAMILISAIAVIFLYSLLGILFLYPINPFYMTFNVIFPIFFMGTLAFMFSTLTRNGNATALIMILIILFFYLILGNSLGASKWNIFMNPYDQPSDMHPSVFLAIVWQNKIILFIATVVTTIIGLLRLQKREKFI
ncbi:MAG: hypothetical protein WC140_05005 [Bacteroidales bacterium]